MSLPDPYYQDDSVTIYHGDCREILPEIEADVLVTDPPYGVGHTRHIPGHDFRTVGIAGDDTLESRDSALDLWSGPALVFGTWKRPRPRATREVLVWAKPIQGAGDLSLPWGPSHEEIYVLGAGFAGRRGPSVLSHRPDWTLGRSHPTEKPVSLMVDLLSKCPEVWVVLDPFAGSGSTLRAAKDLGRKAIGIELEERYCDIAARRLAQDVLDLGAAA